MEMLMDILHCRFEFQPASATTVVVEAVVVAEVTAFLLSSVNHSPIPMMSRMMAPAMTSSKSLSPGRAPRNSPSTGNSTAPSSHAFDKQRDHKPKPHPPLSRMCLTKPEPLFCRVSNLRCEFTPRPPPDSPVMLPLRRGRCGSSSNSSISILRLNRLRRQYSGRRSSNTLLTTRNSPGVPTSPEGNPVAAHS
ncbi:hypothetical protein GH714_030725 [Hevea brasiliensis]|uniref:Uncharacterized protein n=1 Tax=Hevea brasiliensis TaxID=3981 RepID=A0A6A6LDN2_HEVBR|nr:hypothetical protein GH714_030725 [Hevea brasiliensis]